jgi:hypothetical protein
MLNYRPAKENKMFPPELTALIRFVSSDKPMTCAHCQRKIRVGVHAWTMLCDFKVAIEMKFVLVPSKAVLKALSPVCRKHCFSPAIPSEAIYCGDYDEDKRPDSALSTQDSAPDPKEVSS